MYRKQAVRIAKESGIKKDEDDPVLHESVMKARLYTKPRRSYHAFQQDGHLSSQFGDGNVRRHHLIKDR
jgi:hypothetical protein